jgi:hypothetical protein
VKHNQILSYNDFWCQDEVSKSYGGRGYIAEPLKLSRSERVSKTKASRKTDGKGTPGEVKVRQRQPKAIGETLRELREGRSRSLLQRFLSIDTTTTYISISERQV